MKKEIFIMNFNIIIFLKNGKKIENTQCFGRNIYHYNIKPENETIKYDNKKTLFKDLIKVCGFLDDYNGHDSFFKKRKYISSFDLFNERIYEDELESFITVKTFETVEKPIIEYLKKDLNFYEYSELIFNRENELKSLLINSD